jgi:mannosyltransferase OCH1-like enzyme
MIVIYVTLLLILIVALGILLRMLVSRQNQKAPAYPRPLQSENPGPALSPRKSKKRDSWEPKERPIPRFNFRTGPWRTESDAPAEIKAVWAKFRKENPEWKLIYHNDDQARDIVGDALGARGIVGFDAVSPGAYKADLYRFAVLFIYGGTYNDVAHELLVPMEDMVDVDHDTLTLVRDFPGLCPRGGRGIQISFMASAPDQPIMLAALEKAVTHIENRDYCCCWLGITGPCHFGSVLREMELEDFRLELEQTHFYLRDIESGKRMIKMRTPNYRTGIHTKEGRKDGRDVPHYVSQWKNKTVYGTETETESDDPPPK